MRTVSLWQEFDLIVAIPTGLRTCNRDLLLALATMTIESVQQRRVSS